MKEKSFPTKEELFSKFTYNPEDGLFRYKNDPSRGGTLGKKGDVAGRALSAGYPSIRVNDCLIFCHRMAWLFVHGEWPADGMTIDHINGIKTDNRICNLREASRSQNQVNRKIHSNNKSGVRGVSWDNNKQRWFAVIFFENKRYGLGYYKNIEDAKSAYQKKAEELHGNFQRK